MLVVDHLLLLSDFGPSVIICMNVYCCYFCHCNAVKGFSALWDNIYDCVFLLF
jgi:hypothetical protein